MELETAAVNVNLGNEPNLTEALRTYLALSKAYQDSALFANLPLYETRLQRSVDKAENGSKPCSTAGQTATRPRVCQKRPRRPRHLTTHPEKTNRLPPPESSPKPAAIPPARAVLATNSSAAASAGRSQTLRQPHPRRRKDRIHSS